MNEEEFEDNDEQVEESDEQVLPDGITKMVHPDGRVAFVRESMLSAYKSGGYKEV